MTTQDKNIAIAEMLGWKYKETEPNVFIWNVPENLRDEGFAFHSDANWQFEALGYMYSKGYDWSIQSGNYCNINNPEGEEIISINIDPKEGSAIFEALYELSKILK